MCFPSGFGQDFLPWRFFRSDSVGEVRELIGLDAAVTVTLRQIARLILSQELSQGGIACFEIIKGDAHAGATEIVNHELHDRDILQRLQVELISSLHSHAVHLAPCSEASV